MTLSAFFSLGEINENLFRCYVGQDNSRLIGTFTTNGHWDHLKFEDVIAELVKLSLIQRSEDPRELWRDCIHFSLHPMIREWIQLRIAHPERHKFVEEVIMILDDYIARYGKDSSLYITQAILAHQDACVHNNAVYRRSTDRLGIGWLRSPARSFALFYNQHGRYGESQNLLECLL